MKGSPYKGLIPYTEADSAYFFGRETESEIIAANLKASALTVLYGASGVGKSSVIRAGAVRKINSAARDQVRRRRRPSFIAVCCQNWRDDPLESVGESLKQVLASLEIPVQARPDAGPGIDVHTLLSASMDAVEARVLLILDQFEEYLFYHGQGDSPSAFDEALATVVNDSSIRVNVMISLRDDSLSRLDHYKGLIHSVFNNYLRIDHMTLESARDAILKPIPVYCREYGLPEITVEPGLVSAVLEQVQIGQVSFSDEKARTEATGEARIQAPYLQLVMNRLWAEEQKERSTVLRRDTLKRLGESRAIVRNHLDETMNQCSAEECELAERVFFHLVTPSGTKIAHSAADLAAFVEANEASVAAIVEKLADSSRRILRAVPSLNKLDGAPRFEIYHDALAEAILAWQGRFRTQVLQRRFEEKLKETETRKREVEQHRRLRWLLVSVTVAMLVFAGMAWFALRSVRETRRARNMESEQRTRAEAATNLANRRLEQIRKGLRLREAALSGNQQELEALTGSLEMAPISFKADARYLGYSNPNNQRVYEFRLLPDPATLPSGAESVAFVTYLANHPSFRNNLMTVGRNRNFTASYIGWGCLQRIVAVVEYSDPARMPTVKEFDMCQLLGQ